MYYTLLVIPIAWLGYYAWCLMLNYRRASQLNLPMVLVPVSPDNPLWIAIQTGFGFILRHFPFGAFSFTRYCRLGWEFHDRYKTHQRLGDAWLLVTPNRNWLYVAEAEAANEIFSRGRDFGRPIWMLEVLNVFGPNISTAEGPDWQRQRKLTATPFNEQKSTYIWAESLRQATDMRNQWMSQDAERVTSEDVRTLALHVLAYAGFQKSYPFKSFAKDSENPSSYRDSLSIILRNALVVMVVPSSVFSIPFLPAKSRQIGWAIAEFKQYMLNVVAEEKQLIAEGKPGTGNLVSNLVRADLNKTKMPHDLKPLSIDEILGNIFVFNFAGHDTTAISLAYAVLLLVAHPEIQDWISEELQYYLLNEDTKDWRYEDVFPKLKRTLAVLLETLRLYNPLPGTPKYTGSQSRPLTIKNQNYIIPADTLVIPNLMALHTHPRYWGSDSLDWRPKRWISTPIGPSQTPDLGTTLNSEHLLVPEKGTYFPWSDGPRNCPGKKFAQVEFVAVMATLFRNHRVQPIARPGETQGQARQRVLGVVKDSSVELLLQMRDPDSVTVAWSRRS